MKRTSGHCGNSSLVLLRVATGWVFWRHCDPYAFTSFAIRAMSMVVPVAARSAFITLLVPFNCTIAGLDQVRSAFLTHLVLPSLIKPTSPHSLKMPTCGDIACSPRVGGGDDAGRTLSDIRFSMDFTLFCHIVICPHVALRRLRRTSYKKATANSLLLCQPRNLASLAVLLNTLRHDVPSDCKPRGITGSRVPRR